MKVQVKSHMRNGKRVKGYSYTLPYKSKKRKTKAKKKKGR
jgi:hypothetical protein